MTMDALNERQSAFVNAYVVTGNATRAAMEAGYSEKSARSQGQRLLTNADISRAVTDMQERAILGISAHTVDTHLRRAFAKLDTANRTVAAVKAVRDGLVPAPFDH